MRLASGLCGCVCACAQATAASIHPPTVLRPTGPDTSKDSSIRSRGASGYVHWRTRCNAGYGGIQMNWDQMEGNWKQMKGKMREKWGKLTDDD